jgi:ferredoxin
MAQYKIVFNKKKCIGSGACASIAPENWELVETSDGLKAKPKKIIISEEEYDSNSQAEDICPVDAISVEKVKGRKVDDENDFELEF